MRAARSLHRLFVPLLLSSAVLTACDQTDPVEPQATRGGGFQLAAAVMPNGPQIGTAECVTGVSALTKSIPITVRGSDNRPAAGAIVTFVDPAPHSSADKMPRCWGATNANGELVATFDVNAKWFMMVRTEVSLHAPYLEIVPHAAVNTLNLDHTPLEPRSGSLLVGGSRCSTPTEFGWPELLSAANEPCEVSRINKIAVRLPAPASVIHPQFIGIDGQAVPGVIVAAVSAAAFQTGTFDQAAADYYCGQLPFLDPGQCVEGLSHGPAFVHAMAKTDGTGTPPHGLAVGPGKVVIEAISDLPGGALFATFTDFNPAQPRMIMEPGICRMVADADVLQPSGTPAIDLKQVNHGVGMEFREVPPSPGSGLYSVTLEGIKSSLVAKAFVTLNAPGTGTMSYTLRSDLFPGVQNVRVVFSVSVNGDVCTVSQSWSGSGFGAPGVIGRVDCVAKLPEAPSPLGPDGPSYTHTLVFRLYGLPDLTFGSFSLKTDPSGSQAGDNLDPSRSNLVGAEIPFVIDDNCYPVQVNTDGKLIGIG